MSSTTMMQEKYWQQLAQYYLKDESDCVDHLLATAKLSEVDNLRINQFATTLVQQVRDDRKSQGGIDAFMQQYDLSSSEGVALMCLAEAMLRIPDKKTADKLIKDKITTSEWKKFSGQSESFFVNAATWGMMLTGKMLGSDDASNDTSSRLVGGFKKFVARSSEPVIRRAVKHAMKILGEQFVMGETIDSGLKRAKKLEKQGYRFSYDMLGEAACTEKDAADYLQSYELAIESIGKVAQRISKKNNLEKNRSKQNNLAVAQLPGISIKLSALHPRYEYSQRERVLPLLTARVKSLALKAKNYQIGFTIDAEEANRLDMSLLLLEKLAMDPDLAGWDGLGLAVQAYQKRAVVVIDWLAQLAKQSHRRLMVRLVKGAYWDSEVKSAQIAGLSDYPVFSRKITTDVSYIACVKKLIAYGSRVFYPQFASHNARTVASVLTLMKDISTDDYEFQCLHGMGVGLYAHIKSLSSNVACRVYAPVGTHENLLAYLVRRLLENGANSSFVNRITNEKLPIAEVVADPYVALHQLRNSQTLCRHAYIPVPECLYLNSTHSRKNSTGVELSDRCVMEPLAKQVTAFKSKQYEVTVSDDEAVFEQVFSPANEMDCIGKVQEVKVKELEAILTCVVQSQQAWSDAGVVLRAGCLERLAVLLASNQAELISLLMREAGKTWLDAVGEVREAIDFCHYYAVDAKQSLITQQLVGPTGETNSLSYHPRGVVLCISPWNFPLAIFVGQVVAALVAGNVVIAKPAEQTTLIAGFAVDLMYQSGVFKDVLQLVPGQGEVIGATLVADKRIQAVIFTGSTTTARHISQLLHQRGGALIPLVAETGGQNVMIADSSCLPEQLVLDVIQSAFGSAGQRCSALRVLYVQEQIADQVLALIKGAMDCLVLGDPSLMNTDVGPVIDEEAKQSLLDAIDQRKKTALSWYQSNINEDDLKGGMFVLPTLFEIASISQLAGELFGPVLHVVRYQSSELDEVIADVNQTGYGLTFGIHSRINHVVDYIAQRVHVGNVYVNRNLIGATVGVQPFGGEGLSGTGPKAGGPNYLKRLCHERTLTVNTAAAGGNTHLMSL